MLLLLFIIFPIAKAQPIKLQNVFSKEGKNYFIQSTLIPSTSLTSILQRTHRYVFLFCCPNSFDVVSCELDNFCIYLNICWGAIFVCWTFQIMLISRYCNDIFYKSDKVAVIVNYCIIRVAYNLQYVRIYLKIHCMRVLGYSR